MPTGGRGILATALCLALVVGTVGTVPEVGGAADLSNEAPLADAGLDQNVTVNGTVHLDGTGSRDPDGEIAEYEWRLEQPDGNYTRPDCQTCGRTSFVARQVGTYNATITVTDSDGATSSDTLRVYVEKSDGPTVTLTGPQEVNAGEVVGYTASVEAGNANLAAVTWHVDGNWQNRTRVSGEDATAAYLHAFSTSGDKTVSVTVVDRFGRERTATKAVTVHELDADGSSGSTGSAAGSTGSESDGGDCSRFNRDDRYCNNDRMTLDSNGIVISDADNDGTTEWGGQTLDEEFAQNNEIVSYDSTNGVVEFDSQEAYKEALEMDTVNVNPTPDVNQNQETEDRGSTGGDDGAIWQGSTGSDSSDNNNSDEQSSDDPHDEIVVGESSGDEEEDAGNDDDTTNTRTGRVPHNMR